MIKAYFRCDTCRSRWVKRNSTGPAMCAGCKTEVHPYRCHEHTRNEAAVLKRLKRLAEEMCHVVIDDNTASA